MYKASKSLPIGLFLLWWIFWLVIHNTPLSIAYVASAKTQLYYLLMLVLVTCGYIYAYFYEKPRRTDIEDNNVVLAQSGKFILLLLLIIAFLTFIAIGMKSGAFSMSPKDYFAQTRGTHGSGNILAN